MTVQNRVIEKFGGIENYNNFFIDLGFRLLDLNPDFEGYAEGFAHGSEFGIDDPTGDQFLEEVHAAIRNHFKKEPDEVFSKEEFIECILSACQGISYALKC